jgi:hypothetical protein
MTRRDSDTVCTLVIWQRSIPGQCGDCGSFRDLYFPLIRAGADAWRLAPRPIVRCAAHLPNGAAHA